VRVALVCPYAIDVPGGVQGQVLGLAAALVQRRMSVTVVAPARHPELVGVPQQAATPPDRGMTEGAGGLLDHALGPAGDVDGGTIGGVPVGTIGGVPVGTIGGVPVGTIGGVPVGAIGGVPVAVVGPTTDVPANGSVAPVALGVGTARRVGRVLAVLRPAVVHVHEPLAPVVGWQAARARVGGPPLRVATVHRAGGAGLYRALAGPARRLLDRFDTVVAVSDEARATAAAALGSRPCPVVGNGVDLDRLAAARPEAAVTPTVLFVGRHEPRKGLEVLLRAVDLLGPRGPAMLWIVGDGPQSAALRQRWPNTPRRRWWGRVPDGQLASLLAGAHVVCVPSQGGESFGVVLVEAMASRCVVVASDLTGYRAVVGDHGLLVRAFADPGAWAEGIDAALTAVTTATGFGGPDALAASAAYAAQWSMARLADRYLALYQAPAGAR
jgi:phosphatidylinositol alpha-mannosyltransferase